MLGLLASGGERANFRPTYGTNRMGSVMRGKPVLRPGSFDCTGAHNQNTLVLNSLSVGGECYWCNTHFLSCCRLSQMSAGVMYMGATPWREEKQTLSRGVNTERHLMGVRWVSMG
eukprot:1117837-Prorocentrum_minimum.AAC.2